MCFFVSSVETCVLSNFRVALLGGRVISNVTIVLSTGIPNSDTY